MLFRSDRARRRFLGIQRLLLRPARILWWVFFVIFVINLVGGYRAMREDPAHWVPRYLAPVAGVVAVAIAMPLLLKRQWTQNKLIQGEISGIVDDDGIEWNSTYSRGRFPWSVAVKWRGTSDIVLVYVGPNQALFFPKEFFADEGDWERFRQTIRDRVPTSGQRSAAA